MFFFLSKTAGYLFLPSNLLIVAGFVALALFVLGWRREAARVAIAGFLVLLGIGTLPIGTFLLNALENRFPPWDVARGAPEGIIVLGETINPRISRDRGEPIVNDSAGRIVALARLSRQFPSARIIYSGGNGTLDSSNPAEADYIYSLLDKLAVSRSRVVLENRSRDTAENAVFTKALANPQPGERWLLVTSAWHMARAIGSFRRAGFAVEAYPADWRTMTHVRLLPPGSPAENLVRTDGAVHEWIGLLVYWLSGRSSALFPAP